ncbi:MAG: ABC transporter permease, partial [Myxococcota bacterium]
TCLGLLLSSAVKRSDYAVGLVPLVIIPQIVFSEFTISEDQFRGASEVVFTLMPSRWGFESLKEFAQTEPALLDAIGSCIPLVLFGAVFLGLAYPLLRLQKY